MIDYINKNLYKVELIFVYDDLRDDFIETVYILADNLTQIDQFAEQFFEKNIDRAEFNEYLIKEVECLSSFGIWKVDARHTEP